MVWGCGGREGVRGGLGMYEGGCEGWSGGVEGREWKREGGEGDVVGSKGERVVRMHCGVSEGECVTCSARRNRFYFAHPFLMLCLCVHAGISPWQPQARSSCRQKALLCCTSCFPSNKTKTLGRSCWRLSRCVHVSLRVSGCVTLCMSPFTYVILSLYGCHCIYQCDTRFISHRM